MDIKRYSVKNFSCTIVRQAEEFIGRNAIVPGIEMDNVILSKPICCPRCLKAYVLEEAAREGLKKEQVDTLALIIPGKIGHEGYYMDDGKVVKISYRKV